MCPRPDIYLLHAPFGVCRNPANIFWQKCAETAHLSHHRTAFNGIDPNGRAIGARHGRLQTRNCNRRQNQTQCGRRDDYDAALAFFGSDACARHIHRGEIRRKAGRAHNSLVCWFSLWNHGFVWSQNRGRVVRSWSTADIPVTIGTTAITISAVNTAASLMNSRSASASK